MRQRHLDRLFARFRTRGDARALAKIFDATAPELYRVATHLTKDLHAAEDLVQSTFLAAIEARGSWDESQPLLSWLIGILARQAAYERRRRSRTIEPERLEQREASEPAKSLEAQELSHELAQAIDGLPILYREVLIAHLRQGKTPQEIARDLGRAPGTVRVQLHRALEMVRKTLPAGLATGALVAALSPNRKGEALPANCKAFDSGGSEVPLVFFTRDDHGSTWQGNGALNSSAPRGANETFPNLPPGQYELRLSLDGYRETSQTVTVEAGRVRDVSVILKDQ